MADNNTKNNTCPICNSTNDPKAAFCNKCGWEFKILVASDSNYAKQEKEREEKMKAFIAQCNKATQDTPAKTTQPQKPKPQSSAQAQSQVSGFIIFKNRETLEEVAVSIHNGYNTYGSEATTDLHHKINLDPIVFDFAPKHFSIDTCRSKGWVLKDLVGNSMKTKGGNIPENGVYITPSLGPVVINNIIELKIVKL